jgi:hypothetical protein
MQSQGPYRGGPAVVGALREAIRPSEFRNRAVVDVVVPADLRRGLPRRPPGLASAI